MNPKVDGFVMGFGLVEVVVQNDEFLGLVLVLMGYLKKTLKCQCDIYR